MNKSENHQQGRLRSKNQKRNKKVRKMSHLSKNQRKLCQSQLKEEKELLLKKLKQKNQHLQLLSHQKKLNPRRLHHLPRKPLHPKRIIKGVPKKARKKSKNLSKRKNQNRNLSKKNLLRKSVISRLQRRSRANPPPEDD